MTNLIEYIRDNSSPLSPIPTDQSPKLTAFAGIKGVVFDIYGTLIVSAAGDISLAGNESSPEKAMNLVASKLELAADPRQMLADYYSLIKREHNSVKNHGVEYPEVEIREIWANLLRKIEANPNLAEQAAIIFECAANPVWPMDGFDDCLSDLRNRKMHLGIVSNAQFYTPQLFPALCEKSLSSLGFDPNLLIYSFKFKEAKPSRKLYTVLAAILEEKQISPAEILYIGNDRRNDIWPAQLEGFKTVLFAGDQRSPETTRGRQEPRSNSSRRRDHPSQPDERLDLMKESCNSILKKPPIFRFPINQQSPNVARHLYEKGNSNHRLHRCTNLPGHRGLGNDESLSVA